MHDFLSTGEMSQRGWQEFGKLRFRLSKPLLVVVAILLVTACQPIQPEKFGRTTEGVATIAAPWGETHAFSEGYTWYVDPVALRAATLPRTVSLPAGSGEQSLSEAIIATLTPAR